MKKILIATVLAIGLATAGSYAYSQGNENGSGYGMMSGGGYGMMSGGGYGMMGGGYGGYGMGPGMMYSYGDNGGGYNHRGATGFGQNGWSSEQYQKFMNDTVDLRKEMNNKRFEYQEALRNPKTTRQQLSKMEKEMIDLRDKINDMAPQTQPADQN